MNRYLVIYYNEFYPRGFENDVEGRFASLEDAKEFLKNVVKAESVNQDSIFESLYIFDLVEWNKVYVYVEIEK